MFYQKTVTIAANTADASATYTDLKLTAGIIHKVEVHFPPGCVGLAHVQIFDGGHQLYPSMELQNLSGDGETISFLEWYKLTSKRNLLRVRTWNTDTNYDHTVTIRVGVLKEEQLSPNKALKTLNKSLEKLLIRVGAIEEEEVTTETEGG